MNTSPSAAMICPYGLAPNVCVPPANQYVVFAAGINDELSPAGTVTAPFGGVAGPVKIALLPQISAPAWAAGVARNAESGANDCCDGACGAGEQPATRRTRASCDAGRSISIDSVSFGPDEPVYYSNDASRVARGARRILPAPRPHRLRRPGRPRKLHAARYRRAVRLDRRR